MTLVAIDANILVYAEGVESHADDGPKIVASRALLDALDTSLTWRMVMPTQALGELYRVLRRKGRRDADRARCAVMRYVDSYIVAPTTEAVLVAALDLAAEHQFSIFDAIIVSAAAEAGCRALISEDMQDGFVWRGVRIVTPFVGDAVLPPGLR